jgi:uncharacterized protein YkwD
MRTCLFFAACLSAQGLAASFALAEEMPKSEVTQAAAASPAGSGQTTQTVQATRPFHRQPIFLNMLRRNNDIRRRAGLFPHRINPALTAAAQDHANYMARTGQFSHYTNGGPQARANRYGFRGGVLENIAYGTTSVDGAFNMWQGSGAHYASIVSGTTEAGFGFAVGSGGQVYWVGVYASPARGDVVGETDSAVAIALAAEQQRQAAERNTAQTQTTDSNVVPASADAPAAAQTVVSRTTTPTAATPPANAGGQNPAGNVNASNSRPGNTTYYYPQNQGRRRWFRRS